jgi:hypothetical protein
MNYNKILESMGFRDKLENSKLKTLKIIKKKN